MKIWYEIYMKSGSLFAQRSLKRETAEFLR